MPEVEKESQAASSEDSCSNTASSPTDAAAAAAAAANERKHDSGAADLEKVTDYAEEKEIAPSSSNFDDALANIRTKQAAESAQRLAREKELAKVSVSKEDIDLIVQELEIPKVKAERTLREHHGNIVQALASLTD